MQVRKVFGSHFAKLDISSGVKSFLIALLGIVYAGSAFSEEIKTFCISCDEPEQIYLCRVKSDQKTDDYTLGNHCIVNTARRNKHKSCNVRSVDVSACDGKKVSYLYSAADKSQTTNNSRILPGGQKSAALPSRKSVERTENEGKAERPVKQERGFDREKQSPEREKITGNTEQTAQSTQKKKTRKNTAANQSRNGDTLVERKLRQAGNALERAANDTADCFRSLFKRC